MTRAYDKNTEYNNAREILLIEKIYQSFETLEEILEKLKLEEPLFMIKTAKDCLGFRWVIWHYHKAEETNCIPLVHCLMFTLYMIQRLTI